MNSNSKITNIDNLYGNVKVYSINDILLFKSNYKKINWYLDRNLAEIIETNSEGKVISIRLNFKSNGLGNRDEYFLSEKKNICVVTGNDDWRELTKHHVVPYMYRKWFPDEYKSNNCHDIVLITRDEHYRYEKEADKLKDTLAMSMNIQTIKEYTRRLSRKNSYIGMAKAILSENVELEHKIMLCIKFRDKTGYVPTRENVLAYITARKNDYKMVEYYGKMVVDNIPNYQEFIETWRQHFINIMKPKYMPIGWEITKNIYKNNNYGEEYII